ncbi:MAG: DegT/DnrJ/EryC1/StrS family aminotransferase [Deltaproteobacteria bacterium]|nr:DegT/DnrJ/EryC1/StrS family aminotransferase [Deltaproteobacteria bacterium]
MTTPRIPIAGPWITQREIDYVADATANAWYGSANLYHDKFERAFAGHLGVRHAMALPSCTSGLHLALAARGIGPGDEVIVPDITWIASCAPITYVGATPVFADVDPDTWCISASSIEKCLTPRTRALIPVDLYGHPADYDSINELARAHDLFVIEDAAEAVGATYRGRPAGSLAHVGVFSFHGSKTLTTGEGGLLATDDSALYERAAFLRDHGRKPGDVFFFNHEVAFKYKMSSMQAALGLAQLERLDELMTRKRQIFAWYRERLSGISGLSLNYQAPGTTNAYWMITVLWEPGLLPDKRKTMELLAERGIDTRPFFHPLSAIPAYAGSVEAQRAVRENTVAHSLTNRALNLPSALTLEEAHVDRVCDALLAVLRS